MSDIQYISMHHGSHDFITIENDKGYKEYPINDISPLILGKKTSDCWCELCCDYDDFYDLNHYTEAEIMRHIECVEALSKEIDLLSKFVS